MIAKNCCIECSSCCYVTNLLSLNLLRCRHFATSSDRFQQHSLQITSQCNLKRTDFLDVCLDLENGTYCPYRKPNDVLLYINTNSNHPPIIKKQLPCTVARRISELSCSEEMFSKAAPEYNKALHFSGYEDNINYINRSTADAHNYKNKNKRRRNITWFNPPFSNNVATNIGKGFSRSLPSIFHLAIAFTK